MKTSKATPGKHDGKEGRGLSSAKKKAVLFVSFALVLAAFLGAGMLGNGGGDSGSDKAVIGAPGDLDVSPWADIIREIGPVTLGTGEFELQPGLIYEIELAGGAGQPGYDGAGGGDGGSGGNGAVVWFWVDMRGETLARTFTFYVFGGGQGGDRDGDGGYGGDGGSAIAVWDDFGDLVAVAGGGGGGGGAGDTTDGGNGTAAQVPPTTSGGTTGAVGQPGDHAYGTDSGGGGGGGAGFVGGTGGVADTSTGDVGGDGGIGGTCYLSDAYESDFESTPSNTSTLVSINITEYEAVFIIEGTVSSYGLHTMLATDEVEYTVDGGDTYRYASIIYDGTDWVYQIVEPEDYEVEITNVKFVAPADHIVSGLGTFTKDSSGLGDVNLTICMAVTISGYVNSYLTGISAPVGEDDVGVYYENSRGPTGTAYTNSSGVYSIGAYEGDTVEINSIVDDKGLFSDDYKVRWSVGGGGPGNIGDDLPKEFEDMDGDVTMTLVICEAVYISGTVLTYDGDAVDGLAYISYEIGGVPGTADTIGGEYSFKAYQSYQVEIFGIEEYTPGDIGSDFIVRWAGYNQVIVEDKEELDFQICFPVTITGEVWYYDGDAVDDLVAEVKYDSADSGTGLTVPVVYDTVEEISTYEIAVWQGDKIEIIGIVAVISSPLDGKDFITRGLFADDDIGDNVVADLEICFAVTVSGTVYDYSTGLATAAAGDVDVVYAVNGNDYTVTVDASGDYVLDSISIYQGDLVEMIDVVDNMTASPALDRFTVSGLEDFDSIDESKTVDITLYWGHIVDGYVVYFDAIDVEESKYATVMYTINGVPGEAAINDGYFLIDKPIYDGDVVEILGINDSFIPLGDDYIVRWDAALTPSSGILSVDDLVFDPIDGANEFVYLTVCFAVDIGGTVLNYDGTAIADGTAVVNYELNGVPGVASVIGSAYTISGAYEGDELELISIEDVSSTKVLGDYKVDGLLAPHFVDEDDANDDLTICNPVFVYGYVTYYDGGNVENFKAEVVYYVNDPSYLDPLYVSVVDGRYDLQVKIYQGYDVYINWINDLTGDFDLYDVRWDGSSLDDGAGDLSGIDGTIQVDLVICFRVTVSGTVLDSEGSPMDDYSLDAYVKYTLNGDDKVASVDSDGTYDIFVYQGDVVVITGMYIMDGSTLLIVDDDYRVYDDDNDTDGKDFTVYFYIGGMMTGTVYYYGTGDYIANGKAEVTYSINGVTKYPFPVTDGHYAVIDHLFEDDVVEILGITLVGDLGIGEEGVDFIIVQDDMDFVICLAVTVTGEVSYFSGDLLENNMARVQYTVNGGLVQYASVTDGVYTISEGIFQGDVVEIVGITDITGAFGDFVTRDIYTNIPIEYTPIVFDPIGDDAAEINLVVCLRTLMGGTVTYYGGASLEDEIAKVSFYYNDPSNSTIRYAEVVGGVYNIYEALYEGDNVEIITLIAYGLPGTLDVDYRIDKDGFNFTVCFAVTVTVNVTYYGGGSVTNGDAELKYMINEDPYTVAVVGGEVIIGASPNYVFQGDVIVIGEIVAVASGSLDGEDFITRGTTEFDPIEDDEAVDLVICMSLGYPDGTVRYQIGGADLEDSWHAYVNYTLENGVNFPPANVTNGEYTIPWKVYEGYDLGLELVIPELDYKAFLYGFDFVVCLPVSVEVTVVDDAAVPMEGVVVWYVMYDLNSDVFFEGSQISDSDGLLTIKAYDGFEVEIVDAVFPRYALDAVAPQNPFNVDYITAVTVSMEPAVTISGTVIDIGTGDAVGGVDIFWIANEGLASELTGYATSMTDGTFTIAVKSIVLETFEITSIGVTGAYVGYDWQNSPIFINEFGDGLVEGVDVEIGMEFTVSGTVTDNMSLDGVDGAIVTYYLDDDFENEQSVVADGNGYYEISAFVGQTVTIVDVTDGDGRVPVNGQVPMGPYDSDTAGIDFVAAVPFTVTVNVTNIGTGSGIAATVTYEIDGVEDSGVATGGTFVINAYAGQVVKITGVSTGSFVVVTGALPSVGFDATATVSYEIGLVSSFSGRVMSGDTPVGGAVISYRIAGGPVQTVTAGSDGRYTIPGVFYDGQMVTIVKVTAGGYYDKDSGLPSSSAARSDANIMMEKIPDESSFLDDYWWVIAIVAIVIIAGVLSWFFVFRKK